MWLPSLTVGSPTKHPTYPVTFLWLIGATRFMKSLEDVAETSSTLQPSFKERGLMDGLYSIIEERGTVQ